MRKPFVLDSASQRSRMKEYQPLEDVHLYNFFGSPVVRKTLRKGGLVSSKGEVIQRSYNPRKPKIILPPLTFVNVQPKTAGAFTFASSKQIVPNSGRLGSKPEIAEKSDEEVAMKGMKRKSESTSDLSKARESRMRATAGETVKNRMWESSSMKPLSHEEYENMLQRFVSQEASSHSVSPPKPLPRKPSNSSFSKSINPRLSPKREPHAEEAKTAEEIPPEHANPVESSKNETKATVKKGKPKNAEPNIPVGEELKAAKIEKASEKKLPQLKEEIKAAQPKQEGKKSEVLKKPEVVETKASQPRQEGKKSEAPKRLDVGETKAAQPIQEGKKSDEHKKPEVVETKTAHPGQEGKKSEEPKKPEVEATKVAQPIQEGKKSEEHKKPEVEETKVAQPTQEVKKLEEPKIQEVVKESEEVKESKDAEKSVELGKQEAAKSTEEGKQPEAIEKPDETKKQEPVKPLEEVKKPEEQNLEALSLKPDHSKKPAEDQKPPVEPKEEKKAETPIVAPAKPEEVPKEELPEFSDSSKAQAPAVEIHEEVKKEKPQTHPASQPLDSQKEEQPPSHTQESAEVPPHQAETAKKEAEPLIPEASIKETNKEEAAPLAEEKEERKEVSSAQSQEAAKPSTELPKELEPIAEEEKPLAEEAPKTEDVHVESKVSENKVPNNPPTFNAEVPVSSPPADVADPPSEA